MTPLQWMNWLSHSVQQLAVVRITVLEIVIQT
jgi:hypothetical protein